MADENIFKRYFTEDRFTDRYARDARQAVDVIIPIVHTNDVWRNNLISIYREIPVHALLIGDGGAPRASLDVLGEFPRVKVLDQKQYRSLGYCIRRLIESVETEWFVYLHSDVYLPAGWFDVMARHQARYDWFGCPQRITALVEYPNVDMAVGRTRPYAGSQMGRTKAFEKGLARIEDDYVYRQEDFIFADLVARDGYTEGKIEDTFHYHQVMRKASPTGLAIKSVKIDIESSREEKIRAATTQVKGVFKYLSPSKYIAKWISGDLLHLRELGALNRAELRSLIRHTDRRWFRYVSFSKIELLFRWQAFVELSRRTLKALRKTFFR